MANTAGHGKKNFPVALSPRCAYIYLYEPLKKKYTHTTRKHNTRMRTPGTNYQTVGPVGSRRTSSYWFKWLAPPSLATQARGSGWCARLAIAQCPAHRRRHRCSYIFIVSACFFFFGDNFAARPPLDSFDQFDGGRFLATRESIGGHRLVQLSTLSAKKKWRNGWERRNNYGNDALFHLVVSSFAAFWLHCHVAFFHPKGIRR